MRAVVKKIHLFGCRKLVKAREEFEGRNVRVHCSDCRKLLHVWNGIYSGSLCARAA